jgi:hypothetical protein
MAYTLPDMMMKNKIDKEVDAIITTSYETGTFTPTIYGGTVAGTPTYSFRSGIYTKIGRIVIANIRVALSSKGGLEGIIFFGNLPFISATVGTNKGGYIERLGNISITDMIAVSMPNNVAHFNLLRMVTGASPGLSTNIHFTDTSEIRCTLIYETNA